MQKQETMLRLALVAQGIGTAAAYLAVMAGLMYPVIQAAGYLR